MMNGDVVLVPLGLKLIEQGDQRFFSSVMIRINNHGGYLVLWLRVHLLYFDSTWDALVSALGHSCSQFPGHSLRRGLLKKYLLLIGRHSLD